MRKSGALKILIKRRPHPVLTPTDFYSSIPQYCMRSIDARCLMTHMLDCAVTMVITFNFGQGARKPAIAVSGARWNEGLGIIGLLFMDDLGEWQ